MQVENDDVREACERLVQVLMRDEENEEKVDAGMKALVPRRAPAGPAKAFARVPNSQVGSWASQDESEAEDEDDDDDDKIIEV